MSQPDQTMSSLDRDEIDLRPYIQLLLRWWREELLIVLVVVVAVVAFATISAATATTYSSSAMVAIVRTTSSVSFDDRFTTESDTSTQIAARRNALLGLATSPTLATEVIALLGDQLDEDDRQPGRIAGAISARLGLDAARSDSDLLIITATINDPDKAAAIATAWAEAFVRLANSVYGQVPDAIIVSIEAEQTRAQAEYNNTQLALQEYIANDQSAELTRQIGQTEALIDQLRRNKTETLVKLVDQSIAARTSLFQSYVSEQVSNAQLAYQKEQAGRRALVSAYLDAIYNGQTLVFSEQAQFKLQEMSGAYDRLARATSLLEEARTLRTQLADADQDRLVSGALTLQILHLQAFAGNTQPLPTGNTQPPAQSIPAIQFQLSGTQSVDRLALIDEVDALITSLEERIDELNDQIADQSQSILDGSGYSYLGEQATTDSPLAEAAQQLQAEMAAAPFASAQQSAPPPLSLNDLPIVKELEAFVERAGAQTAGEIRIPPESTSSGTSNMSLESQIASLEAQVRQDKAQLELQRSQAEQLAQSRDLAREALTAVNTKLAALNLEKAAGSSEVRLAASGNRPDLPNVPISNRSQATLLATVIGLVLALGTVLFLNYLGHEPFLIPVRKLIRERLGRSPASKV